MFTYNTNLEPIRLRAYGRHIQSLLEKISAIPNKKERNEYVEALTKLMKKNNGDNDSKEENVQIWSDLFVITDYNLDVDSPHPIAKKKERAKPAKIVYKKSMQQLKYCGRYLTAFIKAISEKIGKDSTQDEQLVPMLIKWVHSFHKKEDPVTLLGHIENIMGKKIVMTPKINDFLTKPLHEKRRNYNSSRNARKH
ncbi:MAG: DUF4290 domain-containing protein [Bacteroidota bacterium]